MSIDRIVEALEGRIEFHRKWRLIWSVVYFTGAAGTVIAGALATASAGFITDDNHGRAITAGLALTATVLASLEKVLRLREKWDLHRNSQVALEIVLLKGVAKALKAEELVVLIEQVAQSYSMQLTDLNKGPQTGEG